MKSQQKRTPVKKPRPKMDNKDDITFDDIEIDLSDYGAAQASTMIDTLDTITITGSGASTITLPSFNYGATVGGITTINNINSNNQWTTGTSGYNITTPYITSPSTVSISTDGIDMAAGTDIKIDGQSLKEFMKKMEQRLAILVPDPAKLEKFEALKKAYEHYKTMESLCFDEPIQEPEQ
jgi:hypothetical protein